MFMNNSVSVKTKLKVMIFFLSKGILLLCLNKNQYFPYVDEKEMNFIEKNS